MTKRIEDSLVRVEACNIVFKSGDAYKEAVIEEVDISAQRYSDEVNKTVPVSKGLRGGKLKASHGFRRIVNNNQIKVVFALKASTREAYLMKKIANVLEYGTTKITPTRFQRNAVAKTLKGMNKRIDKRYKDKGGEV